MVEEFMKYHSLYERGSSPREICDIARQDGMSPIEQMRMLRIVCGLTLIEAKSVYIECATGDSIEVHQQKLKKDIDAYLENEEKETSG